MDEAQVVDRSLQLLVALHPRFLEQRNQPFSMYFRRPHGEEDRRFPELSDHGEHLSLLLPVVGDVRYSSHEGHVLVDDRVKELAFHELLPRDAVCFAVASDGDRIFDYLCVV